MLKHSIYSMEAGRSGRRLDRPSGRRWNEVIRHRSVQQGAGRGKRPRVEVSNVVIKVALVANTKGVCRLDVLEMVLEISDVRMSDQRSRRRGDPVCVVIGRPRGRPRK